MQENEQKISPIKQRILQFADTLGVSKRKFYDQIGVSRGTLESKTGITEDVMAKFIANFPEVNIDWLVTGNGEIYRHSGGEFAPQYHTLPLIPFEALAGFPTADNIGVAFADCEQYVVPEFIARGADCLVRVSGSSMYPKYSNGDLLACQIVHDILFFQWGKIYVIDSSQGVLVKRIFQSDIADHIRLVSDNRDNYPPFDFPTSDIRSIAIVVGVIRFE